MPVTVFKYLLFNAGKTAHLDRLCLENSLKGSRANFGRLFVVNKIILRLSKHKCFVTQFVTNMFKGNRNSYDNNVLFSCSLF